MSANGTHDCWKAGSSAVGPVLTTALLALLAMQPSAAPAAITTVLHQSGVELRSDGQAFCRIESVKAGPHGTKPVLLRLRRDDQPDRPGSQMTYAGDGYLVRLSLSGNDSEPFVRVRVAVVNSTPQSREIDVQIGLTRTGASPADSVLAFTVEKKFTVKPLRKRLDTEPFTAGYGVRSFLPDPGCPTMYMPVLALGRSPSVVLMCDQRTAFQFDATPDGAIVSRRFFVPSAASAVDESIDLGGGLGKAPHEFCIGAAGDPSWDDLLWDFLATAYSGIWTKPTVDAGPFMTAGLSNFSFSNRWLSRIYSYGGRLIGLASAGMLDDYARKKNLLDVGLVHREGLRATTGIDRYTRDLDQEKGYGLENAAEPELLWQNVQDSLILGPDGKPVPLWSGMAVNMSPEFSYGQRLLRIVKDKVLKHGFDGVFIDYYLDGDGADGTRTYGQYPFYPTVASDGRFLADLSSWLHERGKVLILNCVAPGASPLLRYADAHACDCQPELFFQWKLVTGPKPLASYGQTTYPENAFTSLGWLRSGFSAMFYGASVPAWAFQPEGADALVNNVHFLLDPETGRPLFARNAWFGNALSEALPVGGDAEHMTSLFYRSTRGMFLALRNLSTERESRKVDFAHKRLGLDRSGEYTLFRWDADKGATLMRMRVAGSELLKPVEFILDPVQTSFLCAVPYQGVSNLGFAAFAGEGVPYVASATDRITAIRSGEDGSFTMAMQGMPGVLGEVQIALPEGWKPSGIEVEGAQEYTARVLDARVVLAFRLAGPLTVSITRSGQGKGPLAPGTLLTNRPVLAELPLPVLKAENGEWTIGDRLVELRSLTSEPAIVRAAGATPSSYVLEFDVTRTTTDRTPQPHVEVILGRNGEGDISVDWNSRFSLMAAHSRELAAGIDTAMHPNEYTKYVRSYRLRIEKSGLQVGVFLSYNGGDSFEDVAGFELPEGTVDALGFALTNSAGRFERISLSAVPDGQAASAK